MHRIQFTIPKVWRYLPRAVFVVATALVAPLACPGLPAAPVFVTSPMLFEANLGQTDVAVAFLAHGDGYNLFLTPGEAVLALRFGLTRATVLRMQLAGGIAPRRIQGLDAQQGLHHYYKGSDPAHWHSAIPTYAGVRYPEVYPGIDLIYHGREGRLEYDFEVAPGADPCLIRIAYEGADELGLDGKGNLIVHTNGGDIFQDVPYAYQETPTGRRPVKARYRLQPRGRRVAGHVPRTAQTGAWDRQPETPLVGLELAAYDPHLPLIIDPVLRLSRYLGGSGDDAGNAIAVDGTGSIYVVGTTASVDFPGVSTSIFQGGDTDVFVTKFDATGTLMYSTYLGSDGALGDKGVAIAVDGGMGRVYLTGATALGAFTPFPSTPGAFAACGTTTIETFVSLLDPDGSLHYSTCIGGSSGGNGIAVDGAGDVYVTGNTTTAAFPASAGAFQTVFQGLGDAFVFKLRPAAQGQNDRIYATYLGGNLLDEGNAIAVDSAGSAYVTGRALFSSFPVTLGAFQTARRGAGDAFVAKLTPAGTGLMYATYLGGGDSESGRGIAVDGVGNAYVTGGIVAAVDPQGAPAPAGDFPVTAAAPDTLFTGTFSGGSDEGFVVKLNPAGTALVFASYLGGANDDEGRGIAVDGAGGVYVAGWTASADFPATPNVRFPPANTGGGRDAYIARYNAAGDALMYSATLGGAGDDQGNSVAVDGKGTAYVTGWTLSGGFPVTDQSVPAGGREAFIAGIGVAADLAVVISDNGSTVGGVQTYSVRLTNNGPDMATGIALAMALPAGVSYLSDDGGCMLQNAGMVSCSPKDLPAGGSTLVQIDAAVNTGETVTASATVSANEFDELATNNTAKDSSTAMAAEPPGNGTFTVTNPVAGITGGGGGAIGPAALLLLVTALILQGRRGYGMHRAGGAQETAARRDPEWTSRLLKNPVFRQPVCGARRHRHFQWLQAIENEATGKSHFPVASLKKSMDGLFQHPASGAPCCTGNDYLGWPGAGRDIPATREARTLPGPFCRRGA